MGERASAPIVVGKVRIHDHPLLRDIEPATLVETMATLGQVGIWHNGLGAEIDCPDGDRIQIHWVCLDKIVGSRRDAESFEIRYSDGADFATVCDELA
jgi:hypothetical protein